MIKLYYFETKIVVNIKHYTFMSPVLGANIADISQRPHNVRANAGINTIKGSATSV